MRRLSSFVGLTLLVAACGGGTEAPPVDGGSGLPDATPFDDGLVDAGMPDVDSGLPAPDAGTGCGACPTGMTCGTANGLAVCRTAAGIPWFKHVIVLVMENTSQSTLASSTVTPFLHSLMANYAWGADYHGVVHPSLPNYIAMTSGADVSGLDCDCAPTGSVCSSLTCNALLSSCGCPQATVHLGDQLEGAGLSWRDYAEDMGAPCNVTAAAEYAPKHVPFLYYPNVQTNAARCAAHVVDYTAFAVDLAGALPTYTLIAPNLVHDMHGTLTTPTATKLANGDAWLSTQVPPILASSAYTDGGLLVIVWDEDDNSGVPIPDAPIPMFLLSPYAKSGGFSSAVRADHSSLLATIEDGLDVPRLGTAVSASPLSDFFPAL